MVSPAMSTTFIALVSLLTITAPAVHAIDCFVSTDELTDAVDAYQDDPSEGTEVALRYGWPIGTWCVDDIEDFSLLFSPLRNPALSSFNEDLSSWNVSSARSMPGMFRRARDFDQPIGSWDVSSVRRMNAMFRGAFAFNQPIGSWNVSLVTDMNAMFADATSFNQPIGNWDVKSVTVMENMFEGASLFNNPVGSWNVSSVTTMEGMFQDATAFNQPLDGWEVGSVTRMNGMFKNAAAFNQPLGSWEVGAVTNLTEMFSGAAVFSSDVCSWAPILAGSTTLVIDMFEGTNCPNPSDPVLGSDLPGPFCFDCLTITLIPIFVSLRVPGLENASGEPSAADYELLRDQVEKFYDLILRRFYLGGSEDGARRLQISYTYLSTSIDSQNTVYRGGIPEPSYNIYAAYGGTTVFSSTTSRRRQMQVDVKPTDADLYNLFIASDTNELLVDFISTVPAFQSAEDVIIGAQENITSFSPSNSLFPSVSFVSSASQWPSVVPSLDSSGTSDVDRSVPSGTPTKVLSDPPSMASDSLPSAYPSQFSLFPSGLRSNFLSDIPSSIVRSNQPSATDNAVPSQTPSTLPSIPQSVQGSLTPSTEPSISNEPSTAPSQEFSGMPVVVGNVPSGIPTVTPSSQPSSFASQFPTTAPFAAESLAPTGSFSSSPTRVASVSPSRLPTAFPSAPPSWSPSQSPTQTPTNSPTASSPPTGDVVSLSPTRAVTDSPSSRPSPAPTRVGNCPRAPRCDGAGLLGRQEGVALSTSNLRGCRDRCVASEFIQKLLLSREWVCGLCPELDE